MSLRSNMSNRFEVHIMNFLSNNNIPLWFDYISENKDFGYHIFKKSTMNLIKNLSILLITLYVSATTVHSFLNCYELHIINALPNNDIPLWYHCASGDKDFGYHILKVGEDFNFEFSVNHLLSTLYFCHFWWGKNQNVFDVFNKNLFHICSSSPDKIHTCYWKVQKDGFLAASTVDCSVNHWEVHIINALPNDDIPLWYHCASGDKDFGYHILKVGEDFHFDFTVNFPMMTTLYFCHFWWGDEIHSCYWKVQKDASTVDSVVNHWEVHIINALPNDDIPLCYHCASGDKDFGHHILKWAKIFILILQ
ncbi:hypothetical protein H5410_029060 [Solanum commersonii]|uniref:S-protein homolog n=1 Tax=Solanum commersonii TaxID=4109 RepID=A0A9J5Z6K1_SOLCO|nr:hypothetical protein H5410_029060 [Solanum commersonii]